MNHAVPSSRLEILVDRIANWLIAQRKLLSFVFIAITLALGASALRVQLDAGFNKLIPLQHPFMAAFLKHSATFAGANRVLVSVQWKGEGDIYNAEFMKVMRGVTDEVFFTPGVNRAQVFSIFTPNVTYIEVTEEGFAGDVVIPSRFVADAEGLARVRANVARSGEIGRLVANDLKSALVRADLLEVDPSTGKKLDYAQVSKKLEEIRQKFTSDKVEIQIIGFAKVVGEVMDGLSSVVAFFGIAFGVTAMLLWGYTRSLKLSALALLVALLPVIWLLGILPLIGYGIDPMSILVPFLIFSIGVSHAVQMTNAWKQDVLAGESAEHASKIAFRNLAIPGTVALLTNALGFMVIMLIDIPIVHELGVTACLGVLLMIMTNKMILPIILSHLKLERHAQADAAAGTARNPLWWAVSAFATPKVALVTFAVWLGLLAVGTVESRKLLTGDVGAGVPELRAESRYNRDNEKIVGSYSIGMDVLSVYAETEGEGEACLRWPVMNAVERFDFFVRGIDGVQSVVTVGHPGQGGRWREQRGQPALGGAAAHRSRAAHRLAHTQPAERSERRRLQGDPPGDLPEGPPGRDAQARGRRGAEVHRRREDARRQLPPGRRQRRRRRGHQRGRRGGRGRDAGRDLRRHHPLVLADLPHLEGGAVHHGAADHRLHPVQRADGVAGHRAEGADAAGDRARRRRRRRLRNLPLRAHAARDRGQGQQPARGLLRSDAPARHGCRIHRDHDVDRRR
jgi:hypothetical protein